jgi:uncharacterized protein YheU (UPF0270 family)
MSDDAPTAEPVVIPIATLAAETLREIVGDLVTRDGTDYGAVEKTAEQKVAALLRLLERGEAHLVFDPDTETIGVMTSHELGRLAGGA